MARKIIESLNVPWVVLLSMDSFYKVQFINDNTIKINKFKGFCIINIILIINN